MRPSQSFWALALLIGLSEAKKKCSQIVPTTLSTSKLTSTKTASLPLSTTTIILNTSSSAASASSTLVTSSSTTSASTTSASSTSASTVSSVTTSAPSAPTNVLVNGGFDTGSLAPWVASNAAADLFSTRFYPSGYNNSAWYIQWDSMSGGTYTLTQSNVYTTPGASYQFSFVAEFLGAESGGSATPVSCSSTDSSGNTVVLATAAAGWYPDWTVFSGSQYFTGVGDITVVCNIYLGTDQGLSFDDVTLIEVV